MLKDLIIGMAGAGGDGIVSAGDSLISAAVEEGYYAMMTKSFGPQIRGGESSCRVRISTDPIHTCNGLLDIAVIVNWDEFRKFGAELTMGGRTLAIYESGGGLTASSLVIGGVGPGEAIGVPIAELSKPFGPKAKNMVVLGLLAGWLGLDHSAIIQGIHRKLGKKGTEVLALAEGAFAAGVEHTRRAPLRCTRTLAKGGGNGLMLADGNDICATAAIFAGCRFFGGYPITPSSEIMQLLSRELWKYGGCVLQAEDEIAGIGAAVGASFAGVKAMTATSGPGMSLKTEMIGLATIAELPLVIVNVQRGGPATGMPTKSEQSDLLQACFSAHGDAMRPVLAPTCVADTFATTVEAFNIAEHYQTPVILLSDQEIAQRKEAFRPIDLLSMTVVDRRVPTEDELRNYARFRLTTVGVSPISHPGMKGGAYLASGIEHTPAGSPTASGEVHARMLQKRFEKFRPLYHRRDLFFIEGDPDARVGLISWGSTAGVCREALALVRKKGIAAKLMVPRLLYPVVEEFYDEFLTSLDSGLVVEQSFQGQFYHLLRMYVNLPDTVESMARAGANPFRADEIAGRIELLAGRVIEPLVDYVLP